MLHDFSKFLQGHTGGNLIALGWWVTSLFHTIEKSSCFTEDARLIARQSSNQDSSLGREGREGRQTVFFTPLNPFGDNPDEEHPTDDLPIPRKSTLTARGKLTTQDAVCWVSSASTGQRITILADKV